MDTSGPQQQQQQQPVPQPQQPQQQPQPPQQQQSNLGPVVSQAGQGPETMMTDGAQEKSVCKDFLERTFNDIRISSLLRGN